MGREKGENQAAHAKSMLICVRGWETLNPAPLTLFCYANSIPQTETMGQNNCTIALIFVLKAVLDSQRALGIGYSNVCSGY